MKIDINKITDGAMDGATIWVCDYRQPDLNKKPIRNVAPVQVVVRPESDSRNTIYYSNSYMSPLSKKTGEPLSKEIKVFDNTGYRSYSGVAISAFTEQAECIAHYNHQIGEIKAILEEQLKHIVENQVNRIAAMENMKV